MQLTQGAGKHDGDPRTTHFAIVQICSVLLFVSEAKYLTTAFNSKLKYEKLAAPFPRRTWSFHVVVFPGEDGKEMCKDL